jgi:hypothetical protein
VALGGDEGIRRLHVAVDLAHGMQRVQRARQLREHAAEPCFVELGPWLGLAERTADIGREVGALDEIHREEPVAMLLEQLVQGDEVRVLQVVERAKLALQPRDRLGGRTT